MISLLLAAAVIANSTNVLSVAEVSRLRGEDDLFIVTGTIVGKIDLGDYWNIILQDDSGRINLRQSVKGITWNGPAPTTGEVVRCHGFAHTAKRGSYGWFVTRIEHLGKAILPDPPVITADKLLSSFERDRTVRFQGVVRNAFFDELDPNYVQLSVRSGGRAAFVTILAKDVSATTVQGLLGRRIEAYGVESHASGVTTGKLRHYIHSNSISDIRILNAEEPIPLLGPDDYSLSPEEISDLGLRSLKGRVLATWMPGNAIIRTAEGRISRLELRPDEHAHVGDQVLATGIPTTDLYNINLTKATLQPTDLPPCASEASDSIPLSLPAEAITKDPQGRDKIKLDLYGRRLTLTGKVRHLRIPSDAGLYLESGSRLVLIDASANPDTLDGILPDSTVAITGICVMNIDNWRPDASFPQIRDFMLVVTGKEDVRVIKSPDWWTPQRSIALTIFLSLVIGSLIVFHHLSKRGANLKYAERTRLAIELHDSIAQTLSGISMQVDTAADLATENGARTREILSIASHSIDSCRSELRNCLWDLRNNALEDKNFEQAIRTTLRPFLEDARFHIRFPLSHTDMTDTDRHAILCIIRELTSNALRHGHATIIRIAGCPDKDPSRILFSVTDNGCGFDPETCPSLAQGHFGLQGLRERVKRVHGTVEIRSRPGQGTKVKVSYG